MILHVVEAHYEHDYVVRVRFNDGAEGLVDPELETIVWDSGADLAPEFLHERLVVPSEPAGVTDGP